MQEDVRENRESPVPVGARNPMAHDRFPDLSVGEVVQELFDFSHTLVSRKKEKVKRQNSLLNRPKVSRYFYSVIPLLLEAPEFTTEARRTRRFSEIYCLLSKISVFSVDMRKNRNLKNAPLYFQ